MKKLILLIFLCLLSSSLLAQIELVSSSPADGDVAVDQDSIVLEFNLPVMIDTEDPEFSGFYFWIEPETKVILDSISVNEDYTKVTFYGQLMPDTDYFAILEKVVGMQGESLKTPYIIQFTTADQAGEYTVSGQLTEETMAKLKASDSYNGFVVVLGDVPFTLVFEEDYEEEEPEDILPLYATTVDTLTGEYVVHGVRENTYYPFALNVFETQEDVYSDFIFPDIYIYDPDGNLIPDSIVVNATTTTDGIMAGIDLVPFDFGPMTFSEAATKAEMALAELENEPALIGGYTFYTYFGEDIFFKQKSDYGLFNSGFKNLKSQIQLPPFRSSFKIKAKTDSDDIFEILRIPSGEHIMWEIYAYDAVKDSAIGLYLTPFGVDMIEYFGIQDAELPEGVQFSDFKLLPETYIDSDQAAQIMEENGGINFRKGFEGNGYWDMELQLLHEFWTYKPDPTPNAPLFWKGTYYGSSFDYENEEYFEDSLTIFVDISTGEILYSETSQKEAISFGQAVAMAKTAAENLENDPIIVAGGTDYWYEPPFYYYGPQYDKQRMKSANSFIANLSTEDGSHYGWQIEPNGYQLEWEIYGYDAVKDSAFGYSVTADTTEFGGYIGVEEAELPSGVTFSSIKPLPETFINSDEAAAIAEREGGERFRNRHNTSNQEKHGYWDLWLQAMHEYWTYEPNPTEDAPVFWKASYYGSNYYHETEEYVEDSLLIFIDIESGEVLHMVVSNERVNEVPSEIHLMQNYPNPFNPSTNIPFELDKSVKVSVNIYNMLGQKVSTIVNDAFPAGSHTVTWDATGLASGVYFYRLEAGGVVQTRKMLLLK